MYIRDRRAIHKTAASVLDRSAEAQRIALVYGLICCGLSIISTVLSVVLSDRISGTGGLGNIGLRSILSTGQSVLPLINMAVTACLSLGYHTAILCFIRGFDASTGTLSSGFRHIGPVLRTLLIQGLIYAGAGSLALYLSASIFVASPFSEDFLALMEPYLSSMTVMSAGLSVDEATLMAAAETMIPMVWILLIVGPLLILPMIYRFRMTTFCLADDPRLGAIHALFKSRRLMRRNCFSLLRLDLDLWWYYAAQLAIMVVCYGDVLLPLVGIELPWSGMFSYYLFLILSLVMQMALYYFGMNRVYTVYAVAYDALQETLPQPNFPATV